MSSQEGEFVEVYFIRPLIKELGFPYTTEITNWVSRSLENAEKWFFSGCSKMDLPAPTEPPLQLDPSSVR